MTWKSTPTDGIKINGHEALAHEFDIASFAAASFEGA